METESKIRKIAFLGDYLPSKCGIATFTSDLLTSVAAEYPQSQCFAVPVNDVEQGYEYPSVVRFEIEEQDLASYQRAADFLNISNVDIVCVQHEFGIYGGPAGRHLLALVRELKMPVVTTFHTLLREPNDTQRRVMQELIAHSTRLVTMTERGRQMLQDIYRAPCPKSTSSRTAFPTSRLWIQIITRTSSAWREGRCCSPSGCFRPTRELRMS